MHWRGRALLDLRGVAWAIQGSEPAVSLPKLPLVLRPPAEQQARQLVGCAALCSQVLVDPRGVESMAIGEGELRLGLWRGVSLGLIGKVGPVY